MDELHNAVITFVGVYLKKDILHGDDSLQGINGIEKYTTCKLTLNFAQSFFLANLTILHQPRILFRIMVIRSHLAN